MVYTLSEVTELTGICRSSLYEDINSGGPYGG